MRTVTGICRECGAHFKVHRGARLYRAMQKTRKSNGRMPRVFLCPKCEEKVLVASHDRSTGSKYRAAVNRYGAGARRDPSKPLVKRGRPWAWRELDDL